jgi:hypothetical protein
MRFIPIFVATFIVFSSANAQSKDSSKPAVSAPIPIHQANDSTPLLTYKDFQELANLIQDYPARYVNPITQWLQQRYQLRAQEYATKPKK